MRFGYLAFSEVSGVEPAASFRSLAEEAQAVERAGFLLYSMSEHHQGQLGEISSPLPWLTALAAVTTRIEIGPAVALVPLYHPVRLAEEVSILDVVSGGRAFLGVGLGYQDRDLAPFGVAPSDRVSVFRASMGLLRRHLGTQGSDGTSAPDELDRITVTPAPVRRPVPLWGGATKPRAIERIARWCDGWICGGSTPVNRLARGIEIYQQAAMAAGRTPRIMLLRDVWITDGGPRAIEAYRKMLAAHYAHLNAVDARPPGAAAVDPAELASVAIVGDAEHCREAISDLGRRVPIDTLLVRMRTSHGPRQAETLEAIQQFGQDVIQPLARSIDNGA